MWELMYADDLVVTADTAEELERKIQEWQFYLEHGGLKFNSGKTETVVTTRQNDVTVNIEDRHGVELKQVKKFKYLGSTLQEGGACGTEVKERVKTAWKKWRDMSGIVRDKRMPVSLKAKIYRTVIRPVLLYGAETWALRKKEEMLLERTEMRMLRWILGITLKDRKRNEDIRQMTGVINISEKIREARLRWFGHIVRRDEDNIIKRAMVMPVTGKRSRGRQKLRWYDTIKRDLTNIGSNQNDALDRITWRRKIRAADPAVCGKKVERR